MIAFINIRLDCELQIAVLSYSESTIAQQTDGTSRGKGTFYDLYGSGHSASAMTAWAWGVSRIIDVLEATPSAGIDTTKIGVTGCSRNGKGALTIGAFEPRIALTIPQESGTGGDVCVSRPNLTQLSRLKLTLCLNDSGVSLPTRTA